MRRAAGKRTTRRQRTQRAIEQLIEQSENLAARERAEQLRLFPESPDTGVLWTPQPEDV